MSNTASAPTTVRGSNRKRILLVDDDAAVRESLTRLLVEEGFVVTAGASGPEAIALASSQPFDLTLLDLNMPGQSGWDTFERLTAQHPLVRVIVITARPNQLFTALAAGVAALMEKPLDLPELLQTMRRLLAESPEHQLDRLTGRPAHFCYQPASDRGAPSPTCESREQP